MLKEKTTIAAIATAMSPGGISIIRISGPEALSIIDKIYNSKSDKKGKKLLSLQKSHTIHYGFIFDGDIMVDEVCVSLMLSPRSFTTEDTVEINCHGGILVTKKILECVLKNGAVPAMPGEFTKRAFLNGRIDLSQAEAVSDIIMAKNKFALDSSVSQLRGSLSELIKALRNRILDEVAYIEAALDDPEHISLDGYSDVLHSHIEDIIKNIDKMIKSFDNGRVLSEGIRTVILGRPNAGKSSLMNAMSGRQRAIVTDIAGTTRDIIEEQIMLDDISLILTDTAGIHETDDKIEKIGVQRALESAENADLVIYVVDSSRKLDNDDREIIKLIENRKSIVILNKSDLKTETDADMLRQAGVQAEIINISAKEETGLEELTRAVKAMFCNNEIALNDQVFITNIRQKQCLCDALESLKLVVQSIDLRMPEDMYTIDMCDAYESLGFILGEEMGEDLVNRIFEKFCMGK